MSKKVSIKEVREFINETDTYEVPISLSIGDKNLSIVFKPYLSLSEESDFVNEVISYVFDKNGNYNPEFLDIAFTSMILKYLSNITLPTLKSDKDRVNIDVVKEWNNSINFLDRINSIKTDEFIGQNFKKYISYLRSITNEKITYLCGKSKLDALFETLTNVVNQYGDKFKDLNIKDVTDVFDKVKNMDESKFVDAIVGKTEVNGKMKDNVTKIEEIKKE
jgi:hypothetical protein